MLDLPVKENPERVPESEIQQVYQHYLTAMGLTATRYSLTSGRRQMIRVRLREFEPGLLCRAIDRCRASPFHMGQNETGALQNDMSKILRSKERVEQWLNGQLGGRNGTAQVRR